MGSQTSSNTNSGGGGDNSYNNSPHPKKKKTQNMMDLQSPKIIDLTGISTGDFMNESKSFQSAQIDSSQSTPKISKSNNNNENVDIKNNTPLKTIPTKFYWRGGGSKVELTGSFCGWEGRYEMKKVGEKHFELILYLPLGKHQYKYIIDDNNWECSSFDQQEKDSNGITNNVIDNSIFIKNHFNNNVYQFNIIQNYVNKFNNERDNTNNSNHNQKDNYLNINKNECIQNNLNINNNPINNNYNNENPINQNTNNTTQINSNNNDTNKNNNNKNISNTPVTSNNNNKEKDFKKYYGNIYPPQEFFNNVAPSLPKSFLPLIDINKNTNNKKVGKEEYLSIKRLSMNDTFKNIDSFGHIYLNHILTPSKKKLVGSFYRIGSTVKMKSRLFTIIYCDPSNNLE